MLGYTLEDIHGMQKAIDLAKKQLNPNLLTSPKIAVWLDEANNFFDGLWAEGYFDNV